MVQVPKAEAEAMPQGGDENAVVPNAQSSPVPAPSAKEVSALQLDVELGPAAHTASHTRCGPLPLPLEVLD